MISQTSVPVCRLHRLKHGDLEKWVFARREAGRKRYGDDHLKRYGLVDAVEEVFDTLHIVELTLDRMGKQGIPVSTEVKRYVTRLSFLLGEALSLIFAIDQTLPDEVCTDELGGDRVWWGRKK